MSTEDQTDLNTDEARKAIAELNSAHALSESVLADENKTSADRTAVVDGVTQAVRDEEVAMLRQRAKRQRDRGVANLQRRYEGVASVMAKIAINERVVASAFERFFAGIETGIDVITKRGDLFVGSSSAAKIQETIVSKIAKMEERIGGELERVKIPMSVHSSRDDFMKPIYTSPAATHEVQLRTKLALRVFNVFRKQDEFVVTLNALLWNEEIDADSIEIEEQRIKKEMRDLSTFIARTLRGMRNKIATAPQSANDQGLASAELSERAEAA